MSIFYLFIECLYLISSQCFIFIDRENVKKKKKKQEFKWNISLKLVKICTKEQKGLFLL